MQIVLLLLMEELIMEIFLLMIILILIDIVVRQGKEIRELDRKMLDAFRNCMPKNKCTKGGQVSETIRL